jgi:hypothetical protein
VHDHITVGKSRHASLKDWAEVTTAFKPTWARIGVL